MKRSNIDTKRPKKNLHYKKYFQRDIFDEDFLNEKDKALSPIVLSDKIPEEPRWKSPKTKKEKGASFNFNEEKDIKYGSNIVFIESKIDENDNEEKYSEIIKEQIKKILIQQYIYKKYRNKRKVKKKNINFY